MTRPLVDQRLVFVTGKGGVGKTTVACALGLLGASAGKRVLICEMEPRGDLARAFECAPTSYVPRVVAPNLSAMMMDTEAALREYLRIHLRIPTGGRITPIAQAFDFVATAAPGVREILTIGKLCYEVRENHFDLVVVDAPATGHIVGHLAAPVAINEVVNHGAIAEQSAWMLEMLDDPDSTGVVVVATPEEMPVTEAIDLATRLGSETGVHLGAVIVNRVLPELFSKSEEELFADLADGGSLPILAGVMGEEPSTLGRVFDAARLAVEARRSGAEHLERLRLALGPSAPLLLLPYLFGRANGPRALRQIADALGDELGGP